MTLPKWKTISEKVYILISARNKFGSFKVATKYNSHPLGIEWTKHIDVLEAVEKEELWRLEQANNRTPFECEIILDYDPPKNFTVDEAMKTAQDIAQLLDFKEFEFKSYFSGSKGYHFHLLFPDLMSCSKEKRQNLRAYFINFFGTDILKKSEGSMIALEHEPHWKTGNIKTEVIFSQLPRIKMRSL